MERDDETGMALHGARYYMPWLGRWSAADPIGLGDGVNRYRYCANDPVGSVDQTGHKRAPYDPSSEVEALMPFAEMFGYVFEWSVGGRARPRESNTIHGPQGGVGGVAFGVADTLTLRQLDLMEDSPTEFSRSGMDFGGSLVPILSPAENLYFDETVSGRPINRGVEALFLAIDILTLGLSATEGRFAAAQAAGSLNEAKAAVIQARAELEMAKAAAEQARLAGNTEQALVAFTREMELSLIEERIAGAERWVLQETELQQARHVGDAAEAGPKPMVQQPTQMQHVRKPRIGRRWRARDINDPKCVTGCERFAEDIQAHIGGEIKRVTAIPHAGGFQPPVGAYRGKNLGWHHHDVVVKDGRVYDAFTGHQGLPIDEFKALWQYPEALRFGF